MVELDRTDIEILRLLQSNARLSFRELAKKTGVSVPTISAHVNTLEQLGILRGYRADIDPERLKESSIVLLIKCLPPSTSRVAQEVAKLEEIRCVMTARGPRVIALGTVPEAGDINALLDRLSRIPEILDYEHFVIASVVKDEPRALITDGLSTSLICFQCKGPIRGDPIKVKMDGRDHYLCCHTCEKLYVERYRHIKAKA
jgi:DNA-binding Lrp family transcriptional regulator